MSQQDMDRPAEPRVAWDSDGDAWEENIAENGEPTGVFKARVPDGDGDELTLGQIDEMYGLDSVDAGDRDLLLWLHAEAQWFLALDRDEHDSAEYLHSAWKQVQYAQWQVRVARAERDRAEASRRDWAAEAVAMDALAERMLTFHGQNEERLSFIARRYLSPARHRDRFTGISSDALAWFAIGRRDEPKPGEYPADERDLAACERTYEMAPEFLKERMLPVLERYRAHVRSLCAVHPEADR